MNLDLYELLGFTDNKPSLEEIKRNYRAKTKECHPDLFPGDEEKAQEFLDITKAYETLMDPATRLEYDGSGLVLTVKEKEMMEVKAVDNLVETFMSVMEQVREDQLDTLDVKELLIQNVDMNSSNLTERMNKEERTIKNARKSLKQFKRKNRDKHILSIAVQKTIEMKNKEIIEIKKAMRILDIMKSILNEYDYEKLQRLFLGGNTSNTTVRRYNTGGFGFTSSSFP